MSNITPLERPLHRALDALQLELAVVTVSATDLLDGKPVPAPTLLGRAWMRLGTWYWHEDIADLLPRIRQASGIAARLSAISRPNPAGIPLPVELRVEVRDGYDFIEQLRREVSNRKHSAKEAAGVAG